MKYFQGCFSPNPGLPFSLFFLCFWSPSKGETSLDLRVVRRGFSEFPRSSISLCILFAVDKKESLQRRVSYISPRQIRRYKKIPRGIVLQGVVNKFPKRNRVRRFVGQI